MSASDKKGTDLFFLVITDLGAGSDLLTGQ
jgi:hypothetical protein